MNRLNFITQPSRIKLKIKRKIKKRRVRRDKFTKTVGEGWVGKWDDETLGWGLPHFLSSNRKDRNRLPDDIDHSWFYSAPDSSKISSKISRSYLCRITVEQIFDKNGKPIVRKNITGNRR